MTCPARKDVWASKAPQRALEMTARIDDAPQHIFPELYARINSGLIRL